MIINEIITKDEMTWYLNKINTLKQLMDVNGEQQGEYACWYWGLKGLKAVVHLEYCTLLKEI